MGRISGARGSATLITVYLLCICAQASPITGLVSTNGSVTVNLTQLLFASATGTPGIFNVAIPDTGSFSGLAGNSGIITSLSNTLINSGPEPIGVAFSDPNWMVFSGPPTNANISFGLQFINPGVFPVNDCSASIPLASQTCSLPNSPFNLTNNGPVPGGTTVTGVGILFSATGVATNTLTGETSNFTGALSTSGQVLDSTSGAILTTLQQVVASIEAGHNINANYSGGFSAFVPGGVPEPSTIVLASLGALSLMIGGFRRKRV
jgi:PEP-CTERM motif